MASARPVVSVYQHDNPTQKSSSVPMPWVLTTPLRPDLVRTIHTGVSKNKRQCYALNEKSGYDTAAESWGTGRAVARIPRVPGGGTHRSGQAAFGNMCRGGSMFNPNVTWRRWHRRVNVTQKRHAVATALAASALPPLVMARGHRINDVAELPLVVSDGAESLSKTKQAIDLLKKLGCEEELTKVTQSKRVRAGKGKYRNRKYTLRRGPLVVYGEDSGLTKALRNIPGVESSSVDALNLLQLAPGGVFGRFVIFTESAFKKLNEIYGSYRSGAPAKKGYRLPRAAMENADVARIINSDEIQSVVRPKLEAPRAHAAKKNPLTNPMIMGRLNPGALQRRKLTKRASIEGTQEYAAALKRAKKIDDAAKKNHKGSKEFYNKMMTAFEAAKIKNNAEDEGEAEEDGEE